MATLLISETGCVKIWGFDNDACLAALTIARFNLSSGPSPT